MKLIPMPKLLRQTKEVITYKTVRCCAKVEDQRLEKAIAKLPASSDGLPLALHIGNSVEEGYTLDLTNAGVVITAPSVAGGFYAVQTLRQIFENETVYACHIEDAPDFGFRGFYHDVTRGRIPTLETLKELVDYMAYMKLNSLQLYMEHSFAFREYADSISRTGCLTAQEIRELDAYCQENFIELIPSLSCFGHLYELLEKPQYQHLQVADQFRNTHLYWYERMNHHTIDPLHPESIALIKSMIDQFLPLFHSNTFNICCDETFDLQKGKYKDKNIGKLYADFVNQLIDYLNHQGKKVMMWGDVLHQHLDCVQDIPEDIILLNWYYDVDMQQAEDRVKLFREQDRKQIVCPGTWTWNHFSELLTASLPNIKNMTALAHKYSAIGVLNTNWGDYGNPCSLDLSLFGLTYGAARSWNVLSDLEEVASAADLLIYKHRGTFSILYTLSEMESIVHYGDLSWMYNNLFYPEKLQYTERKESELLNVRRKCFEIREKLSLQQWEKDYFRQEILLAVEGVAVMAELMLKVRGFGVTRLTDTESWLAKYRKAWLKKNKESELAEIENMFRKLEKTTDILQ